MNCRSQRIHHQFLSRLIEQNEEGAHILTAVGSPRTLKLIRSVTKPKTGKSARSAPASTTLGALLGNAIGVDTH